MASEKTVNFYSAIKCCHGTRWPNLMFHKVSSNPQSAHPCPSWYVVSRGMSYSKAILWRRSLLHDCQLATNQVRPHFIKWFKPGSALKRQQIQINYSSHRCCIFPTLPSQSSGMGNKKELHWMNMLVGTHTHSWDNSWSCCKGVNI